MINWETSLVEAAVINQEYDTIHHYKVDIETELGEKERLSITAVNKHDAREEAIKLVANDRLGLEGIRCVLIEVHEEWFGTITALRKIIARFLADVGKNGYICG